MEITDSLFLIPIAHKAFLMRNTLYQKRKISGEIMKYDKKQTPRIVSFRGVFYLIQSFRKRAQYLLFLLIVIRESVRTFFPFAFCSPYDNGKNTYAEQEWKNKKISGKNFNDYQGEKQIYLP